MGRAMLSKSFIQFSVDGCSYVPSLLFTWSQTMVDIMKVMATSFKRSHVCTAAGSAPTLQQAVDTPCLHQRHLDTHLGQSLLGSLLLFSCPGVYKFLFCFVLFFHLWVCVCVCPPRVCFPVLCKFGSSMVGLMVTSSKSVYAIPRSTASRAPVPAAGHC